MVGQHLTQPVNSAQPPKSSYGFLGVELHRSSIREVVLKHAQRAAEFVGREDRETVAGYEKQRSCRLGQPWLIVGTGGSMVGTGELAPNPAGGASLEGRAKRNRIPSGGKCG